MLASTALFFVLAGPSQAGEPVYNWAGAYVGANVGYGQALTDADLGAYFTTPLGVMDLAVTGMNHVVSRGGLGGFQAGYNFQPARHWVFGVEGDFQWSGLHGSAYQGATFNVPIPDHSDCEGCGWARTHVGVDQQWFGTIRQRVGYARDNLLFYSTSGVAFGRISINGIADATVRTHPNVAPTDCEGGCTFTAAYGGATTKIGWTTGFGVEGLSPVSGWSWKLEYLYVDLGTVTATTSLTGVSVACVTSTNCTNGAINTTATYHARLAENIVRFGVNYRFSSGPPGE